MIWSAVWVKSRHEKAVKRHLDAQGVTAFLPLYSARHKWSDRDKVVQVPMFPNYVFCELPPQRALSIRQIPGVVDYVRCGSGIAPIDAKEIDALKRTVTARCEVEPWPTLVSGMAAEIIAGPLGGLTGVVVEYRGRLKLVLAVTLLKRSVLVEVDPNMLRMIEPTGANATLASVGKLPVADDAATEHKVDVLTDQI